MKQLRLNNTCTLLLIASLFLSVNTVFFLTPFLLIIAFLGFLPILFLRTRLPFPDIYKSILILFAYCFLSAIISNLPLDSWFNFKFYRYDANLYYSYCPFLFLPLVWGHKIKADKYFKAFVIFVAIILPVSYIFLKIPFFKAHNALGGFMAIVIALNFYYVYINKRVFLIIPLVMNIFLIILSDSRGSILSLLIGTALFLLELYRLEKLKKASMIILILFIVIVSSYGFCAWVYSGKPTAFSVRAVESKFIPNFIKQNIERYWTIEHRIFYLWPIAIDNFINSPILGSGFSRYNDYPYYFEGFRFLAYLNRTDNIIFSDSHAHNSYVHILSELGLLGIYLFYLIYKNLVKEINNLEQKYKLLIRYLLYIVIISGFTEHRITTPAQMTPFVLITVIIISMKRENFKINYKHESTSKS